ncbi:hypothetical protein FBZ87_104110 [Nitrospirillum amazonense]|uniref:Uncharacterized protein n=2 Tax=Nitrospirillum amazonense TaxID=28077 RepID=A0A560JZP1_9PROT|nr:hypothetical protein FBZ87_104110 [Nitrospirillum amazonense]
MKVWCPAVLLVSLSLAAVSALAADACVPDRAALLALDGQAFDQDLTGGWRPIAEKPGCLMAAADLLRDYRAAHPQEPARILYWHEGQVRALAGDTAALTLMEQSHDSRDTSRAQAWNAYVDATLAFLRHDRPALQAARDRLSHVPRPPLESDTTGDSMMMLSWPMNMGIVDGLLACFGKPYADAYGGSCTTP